MDGRERKGRFSMDSEGLEDTGKEVDNLFCLERDMENQRGTHEAMKGTGGGGFGVGRGGGPNPEVVLREGVLLHLGEGVWGAEMQKMAGMDCKGLFLTGAPMRHKESKAPVTGVSE
jgi:hypothetical protein